MDLDVTPYAQDDPADTASGIGYALSMVEVARYWNRRTAGPLRLDLAAEVAEAREAQRLTAILTCLGEVSSPLAPLEVLEVGATGEWTASGLRRLGFRVERTSTDPAWVTSPWLFDLVLAPESLRADDAGRAAVLNLASLVRLGGRLVVAGEAQAYRSLLEPRGFRSDVDPDTDTQDDDNPGALLAWTRES